MFGPHPMGGQACRELSRRRKQTLPALKGHVSSSSALQPGMCPETSDWPALTVTGAAPQHLSLPLPPAHTSPGTLFLENLMHTRGEDFGKVWKKWGNASAVLPDDPGDRAEGPGEGFMVLVGCGGRWVPEMYLLSRLSKLLEPASSNWREKQKRQICFD